ncbi:LPS-assembly protein LptD [hot springs metagenome]|uniref:LPS-assembly protein LptD n=1 Tax=hot springs metagenome TaxID=433727 RepID=A0A5J4L1A8_9ZZZZ
MRWARGYRQKAIGDYLLFLTFILLPIAYCLLPASIWATTITADHLEHFKDEDKYVATGNVRIEGEDSVLIADRAVLYQKTSDAEAIGNVIYEDNETFINTEKAELNIKTKTGKLYNALIFFKKGNYWINGNNVSKIKEDHYYADSATFTTCDADASSNPDWCFKGSNVDIVIGKKFTAQNVTYRVKGVPVLYSPYMWAPVKTERETGFLFPVIGSSSRKGFQFSPAFFWAIDENKDATFYLDYYSNRGIGKGVEYRYLDFYDRGRWYIYHLKDSELKKTFYEFKGTHEQELGDIKGYVDINYVNQEDFYKEYGYKKNLRIQRFLQSSGEVTLPLQNARFYLLGQQWIDLKEGHSAVPKRLPEIGYVINPVNIGPLMFTMNSSIANFYRQRDEKGQRMDINPTVSYSFGETVPIFQSLSLRETAYNLENAPSYKSSAHRETFQYKANALTRFIKRYESFTHVIEPSVSYTFIPETHSLPLFDSTELFDKTSIATFSIYNSLAFRHLTLSASLSQSLNFNAGDRPLSLTTINAAMSGPFSLNFDMTYDPNKGRAETVNSSVGFTIIDKTSISFGERYTNVDERYYYTFGVNSVISKKWSANANIGYDSQAGLRDSSASVIYTEQCWAVNISAIRRPGDNKRPAEYGFMILIELKGVGQPIRLYQYQTHSTPSS